MSNDQSQPLPIDGPSSVEDMTYRELVHDLDSTDEHLSEWEKTFVADAVDHPEKFVTPKQLGRIVTLWEQYCG